MALDQAHDEKVCPSDQASLFEFEPVPAEAWPAFEQSDLCDRMHALMDYGHINYYEECYFSARQLPALVALIDSGLTDAPAEARDWLANVAQFARRAHARGVGLTFMIGGLGQ